jgi:Zn finger protein HypA/HybF involved in hydrogenase expression
MVHATEEASMSDTLDCPRCGCNDTTVISEPSSVPAMRDGVVRTDVEPWATPGRAKCNHCQSEFNWTDDAPREVTRPLVYDVLCPECGSADTYVASSPAPQGNRRTRYMKCRACKNNFKTVDKLNEPQLHLRTGDQDNGQERASRQRAAG